MSIQSSFWSLGFSSYVALHAKRLIRLRGWRRNDIHLKTELVVSMPIVNHTAQAETIVVLGKHSHSPCSVHQTLNARLSKQILPALRRIPTESKNRPPRNIGQLEPPQVRGTRARLRFHPST